MSVRLVVVVWELPTAKQLVVTGHATLLSRLEVAPVGLGLVTIDHVVPFQRSMSVFVVVAVSELPTAMQLVTAAHFTPDSRLAVAPGGLAVVTVAQNAPFQRIANVLAPRTPTAWQLVAPEQEIPDSAPGPEELAKDHPVPFQR